MRAALCVVLLLACFSSIVEADDPGCAHYWCHLPQKGSGYLAAGYATRQGSDGGDNLTGLRLEWGGWLETPYQAGFKPPWPKALGLDYWMSRTHNDEQDVWTAGFSGDFTFFSWGPVRVFPRLHLGMTYRSAAPHPGWGLITGAGLGTGILVGPHSQIVFAADYDIDSAAPEGFRTFVGLRFLDSRIIFPVME